MPFRHQVTNGKYFCLEKAGIHDAPGHGRWKLGGFEVKEDAPNAENETDNTF